MDKGKVQWGKKLGLSMLAEECGMTLLTVHRSLNVRAPKTLSSRQTPTFYQ